MKGQTVKATLGALYGLLAGLHARYALAASAGHGEAAAAHDAAAGGGHEAASGGLPQFDPSTFPSQLFWLAATFLLLYLFFSIKTLPAISSVLENRREHIRSDLEMAEKLKAEAERAQEAYEKLLTNAREESSQAVSNVTGAIKARAEKEQQAFREKHEHEVGALEKRIAKAKTDAMKDMTVIAAEIASEAADRIVGIKTDLKQAQSVVQSLNSKKEAA